MVLRTVQISKHRQRNCILTPWSTVLPEKLKRPKLLKKFLHFMEPEGSSPHSQEPATCPYPEPD